MEFFVRNCPVCGAGAGEYLGRLQFAVFDQAALNGPLALALCPDCGLGFYDGGFTVAEVERYYGENAYYATAVTAGAGGESPFEVRHHRDIVDFLRPRLSPHDLVVDVGAGRGGLLSALAAEGYEKTLGVDPLPESVALMRARGRAAARGSALRLPLERPAGLLTYSHVFEHLFDPRRALAAARRALRPDGRIFIEVPDASRYTFYAPFQELYLEHLNHFDPASLLRLAEAGGFEVEEMARADFETGPGKTLGVIRLLARPGPARLPGLHPPAGEGPARLRAYWRWSVGHPAMELVAALASGGRPVWVWGVSQMTMLLLGSSPLGRANLAGLVDRDPFKQTKSLGGRPIRPPEALAGRPAAEGVLLAAWGQGRAMRAWLRHIDFRGPVFDLAEYL